MNSFNFISLLLTTFIYKVTATVVVIECTFPCLEDNQHVCEVTNHYVKCKQREKKTKWILKNTISLPEYQGTRVEFGQTCVSAPQPNLKSATNLSKNKTESTMEWPPQASLSDYDLYYSNCVESLYCDEDNICVKQFEYGEICQSDNQCFQGVCEKNTCQMDSARKHEQGRQKLNTLHTILTVVGIILFISLIVGICMFRRRKNQKSKSSKKETVIIKSRSNSTSSTVTTTNPSHTVTNILQPDYESAFITSSSHASHQTTTTTATSTAAHQHTPSMQQFQLQRQLLNLPKPPPPYSP